MIFGNAVRGVLAGFTLFALAGCQGGVDKINELLQASQGELQQKRALSLSEASLPGLQRLDIAFTVRKDTLETIEAPLLKSLNDSKSAKENGISFKDVGFSFGEQRVILSVDLVKQFGDLSVEGRVQVSSFVGAASNALLWNLYVDGIEVTRITPSSNLAEAAAKKLVEELNGLLPILNAILDEAVNDDPKTAVLLSFDKKDFINKQLADRSKEDAAKFKFDEKELETGLATTAAAILIGEDGIFAAAQVEFVPPDQVPDALPTFPEDSDLIRISAPDAAARVKAYRTAVADLANKWAGGEIAPLVKLQKTGIAVSKAALARLINFTLKQGEISGTAFLKEPSTSSAPLTFKIAERDCHAYFDACDYKPICEGNRCEQKVTKTINKTCDYSCCGAFGGLFGAVCLFTKTCQRACDEIVEVIEPIAGPACDGFRAADKLHAGALCGIASNVDKAVCDIDANLRKSLCDVEQEIRKFYTANPVATITSTVVPDAALKVSANDGSVSDDLLTLEATVAGSGGGRIKASLGYDRHNYADALVIPAGISLGLGCVADWNETVDVEVQADPFTEHARFTGAWKTDPDKTLVLEFTQAEEKTLYVDFKPPPLLALFVKPEFTLKCPLLGGLAAIFGLAEAVFTQEDARQVFPLLTGEDFPITLKETHFALKLKPIKVCSDLKEKKCDDPLAVLVAEQKPSTLLYMEE